MEDFQEEITVDDTLIFDCPDQELTVPQRLLIDLTIDENTVFVDPKIEKLEESIKQKTDEIEELKEKCESLISEMENLKCENDGLKNEKSELITEKEDLHTYVTSLEIVLTADKAATKNVVEDNIQLKMYCENMNYQFKKHETHLQKFVEKYAILKHSYIELIENLKSCEKEFKSLEASSKIFDKVTKDKIEELEGALSKQENTYKVLKEHALEQLNKANDQIRENNVKSVDELRKKEIIINHLKTKVNDLEFEVERKNEKINELNSVIDGLTN